MYLLHHLLERSARRHPETEAIVDRERRFSYREFAQDASTCTSVLLGSGIRRGDRIGIYLPKSYEESVAVFGISGAGGVFVPINPLLRPPQVEHIVRDCTIRFLITTSDRWDGLAERLAEAECVERIFLVDGQRRSDDPRQVPRAFERTGGADSESTAVGEDLAAILYTSGSTGRPKGVMLSHRNLLAGSRIVSKYLGLRHDERILSVLPFSFDYGLNQVLTATEMAATTVLCTFRFANEIIHALEEERITGLAGVPTIWAVLAQSAETLARHDLRHLRYVTNSGGAVPLETLRKLRDALPRTDVVLMYGLTEAFRSTYLPPSELDRRPTSMGKAIPETEILLVTENGEPCEPGEAGILVHRGPTVSLGYWNRPEDTAAVLRPHPFIPRDQGGETVCYSGDLVRMDEDGYFYFIGRNDAMIKSSGYRISPTEVEEVLMSSGYLSQAAVIGLPDPAAGERVHAVVIAAKGTKANPESLLALCARDLPSHMVPREIEFLAELPRSPNGKVDYKRLRADRAERARQP